MVGVDSGLASAVLASEDGCSDGVGFSVQDSGSEATNALLFAMTANVVDFYGAEGHEIVDASVAKHCGGGVFGKAVDCAARAVTDASAMLCLSGRAMKREGLGWERRRMSVGR